MGETVLSPDTCVFSDKAFIAWATSEPRIELNVSPIVYMERLRQLKNNPRGKASLDSLMERAHIKVSNFDKNSAVMAAEFMSMQPRTCPKCNKLDWNDVMILASTYRPASILVTDNIRDFSRYVGDDKLITPDEAMNRFRCWS